MNQTIQNSICQGRVRNLGEPFGDRHLGNYKGRCMTEAIIENFQNILGTGLCERVTHPIVQDEEIGACEGAQQVGIRDILSGVFKRMQQTKSMKIGTEYPRRTAAVPSEQAVKDFPEPVGPSTRRFK